MYKLLILGLVVLASAQKHEQGHATSYTSFTQHIQHVQPVHHHSHGHTQSASASSGSSSSASSVHHHVPVTHHTPDLHVPVVHHVPVHHASVHQAPVHYTSVHQAPVHHVPVHQAAVHHVPQHHAQVAAPVSHHHHAVAAAAASTGSQQGGHHGEVHHEIYAIPKYHFKYGVEDHHTGDFHSQEETRDGDKVKGYYTLHEADGTTRIVHYTADKHSGFNAIVERKGHAQHPQVHHGHHQ